MPQWKYYSEDWEHWKETFSNGRVLEVYRHPEGYEYLSNFAMMQGGWVIVYRDDIPKFSHELEKICLERGTDMLMITCIMHEMRKKYGGPEYADSDLCSAADD